MALGKEYGYTSSLLTENQEILDVAPKLKSMVVYGWFLFICTFPIFLLLPFSVFIDNFDVFHKLIYLISIPLLGMADYMLIRDAISSKLFFTNNGLLLKRFNKVEFISYNEIEKITDTTNRGPSSTSIKLKSKKTYTILFLDTNQIKEKIKNFYPAYTEPEKEQKNKKQTIIIISILIVLSLVLTIFEGYLIINKDKDSARSTQSLKERNELAKNPSEFVPYIKTVQAKIKKNWHPPKDTQSRSMQVLFSLNKNGELTKSGISKSSGNPEMDNSVLKAVNKSSPFEPLPNTYKEPSVDMQFTFDYNVKQ